MLRAVERATDRAEAPHAPVRTRCEPALLDHRHLPDHARTAQARAEIHRPRSPARDRSRDPSRGRRTRHRRHGRCQGVAQGARRALRRRDPRVRQREGCGRTSRAMEGSAEERRHSARLLGADDASAHDDGRAPGRIRRPAHAVAPGRRGQSRRYPAAGRAGGRECGAARDDRTAAGAPARTERAARRGAPGTRCPRRAPERAAGGGGQRLA